MPQLQVADYRPPIGFNPIFDQNDEAVTSKVYGKDLLAKFEEIYKSAYWLTKARFFEARRRLSSTVTLGRDWNTYGAEPPNDLARALAGTVLDALEADLLPPSHLVPSAEGGIAISFVEGFSRAAIEIYNTGEIAAATYSGRGEPAAWELSTTESTLKKTIFQIRVHLAS